MQGKSPDTLEPTQSAVFSFERWRENFLRLVLVAATVLGAVAAVVSSIDVVRSGNPELAWVYGGTWLLLLALNVRRWPYAIRAWALLALCYALAVSGLLENGMRGDARLFFLGLTIMAAMLVDIRAGFFCAALGIVTIGVVGALALPGTLKLLSKVTVVGSLQLWLVSTLDLALLDAILLTGLLLFLREFTSTQERLRRSFDALASEHTLLRTVIDNVPDAIYAKDGAGRRQLANRADALMMNADDVASVLGKTGAEVLQGESAAELVAEDQEVLRSGAALINREVSIAGTDGRLRWLLVSKLPLRAPSGEIVGMVGIDRDITERKRIEEERARLEEQLRLSQRLESMGRLAGGLAHDINNLLSPIIGYSEVLRMDPPEGKELADGLEQISEAARRMRDLLRQLLSFGRQQELTLAPVDLRETVRTFGKLLRRTVREDVALELRLPEQLGPVRADVNAVEQILLNLVLNAQDAMPKGGRLTIELADRSVDEAQSRALPGLGPGTYVALTVSDTGVGMDPSTATRAFDPFFTTKSHGTGLGLSSVYGLVQQHGGGVAVSSRPGEGATFTILLPRSDAALVTLEAPPASAKEPSARGTETVLVVDDVDDMRAFACTVLTRLGYHVLSARSGAEALQLCASGAAAVDLLVADVIMPEMGGRALSGLLRGRHPAMKVLYMSGYTPEMIGRQGAIEADALVLWKPFLPDDLGRAVRVILDGAAGSTRSR